ncbi:hypothetical protein DVW31_13810, partial [Enterococcus faecium]
RCLFYMFWKIKKMLVSSTNIKKYRALFYKPHQLLIRCLFYIFMNKFNDFFHHIAFFQCTISKFSHFRCVQAFH